MFFRKKLNFLILIPFISLNAFGQEDSSSVTKLKSNATESAVVKKFNFGVQYTISSDLAEQESPRTLSHSWLVNGSYKLPNNYSIWSSVNTFYDSQGNKILADDNGSPFSANISGGINKKVQLGSFLKGEHRVSASLGSTFPISDLAQYEKKHAIPGAKLQLLSNFFDSKFIIENTLIYTYILQEYKYSPVTGKINSKDSLSYSINSAVSLIGGLSASLGFGISFSRKLDNSVEYKYNNSLGLDYEFGKFSIAGNYENGGFTRDGDVKLWYVDQYRRIFSGTVGYSF